MVLRPNGELTFILNEVDLGPAFTDSEMHDENVYPVLTLSNCSIEIEAKYDYKKQRTMY